MKSPSNANPCRDLRERSRNVTSRHPSRLSHLAPVRRCQGKIRLALHCLVPLRPNGRLEGCWSPSTSTTWLGLYPPPIRVRHVVPHEQVHAEREVALLESLAQVADLQPLLRRWRTGRGRGRSAGGRSASRASRRPTLRPPAGAGRAVPGPSGDPRRRGRCGDPGLLPRGTAERLVEADGVVDEGGRQRHDRPAPFRRRSRAMCRCAASA